MQAGKRKAPAGDTDAIVRQALQQEEAERKAKKESKHGPATDAPKAQAKKKGMTLEEVEAAEGGVVRESQVGMAHVKRAKQRKAQPAEVGDTELVEDVEAIEEALEVPEDDGQELEPFNMADERTRGYFDEGGHYVERPDKDEEDVAKDAWLTSGEAAVVSEAVRRQIAERQAAEAAAEAAPPMGPAQVAALQRTIAHLLEPGETVTRALKRLGALTGRPAPGAKKKKGGAAGTTGAVPAAATPTAEQAAARAAFDRLTEAASALMDSGELDVYSMTQREFERAAAPFAPAQPSAAAPAVEDGDDMFADSDDEKGGPGASAAAGPSGSAAAAAAAGSSGAAVRVGNGAAAAGTSGQAGPSGATAAATTAGALHTNGQASGSGGGAAPPGGPGGAAQAAQPEVDYASWPIKELRRFLTERGVATDGLVEKADLVARVREAAAAGPEGELAAAPPGYAFDPASGHYFSAEANLYWDASSGGYYSAESGQWFAWDAAAGQFVPWPTGASS